MSCGEQLQKITVNTGLNSFLLIDSITEAESRSINGIKTFINDPIYLGLESLAQLGAFHVRFLTGFERHAFVLKITRCQLPAHAVLNGRYHLHGELVSQSVSAFSHVLQAKKGDKIQIEGEFLFATVEYDHNFRREILQDHNRKVFSCLQKDSEAG
jgi:3-hydroxymyristoyl/3-hydroxydecanoyl-(acyl carrier protein) dehydratase